jgi:chondroitin AC lyase
MSESPLSVTQDMALVMERLKAGFTRYKQDTIIDSGWYEPIGVREQHTYYVNGAPDDDRIEELCAIQREDGSWPGVVYSGTPEEETKAWVVAPQTHVLWMMLLAEGLSQPRSRNYESSQVAQTLVLALRYWLGSTHGTGNWWWHRIGSPRWLSRVLVLARGYIPNDLMDKAMGVFAEAGKDAPWGAPMKDMAQAAVWSGETMLIHGILMGDAARMMAGTRMLESVMSVQAGNGEGLQRDWSFHQAGPALYSGGSGYHFSVDVSRMAWQLSDTRFALDPALVDNLRLFLLEHQQWIVRGQTYDPGVLGREIARPGRSARLLVDACDNLLRIPALMDDEELRAMRDRLLEPVGHSVSPLMGSRVYWKSDYLVHHRQEFFVSVRMHSTRLRNTEVPRNLEGISSHHMADGALFIMCNGREYDRVFPAWNWRRIPGTTAVQSEGPLDMTKVARKGESAFAGGATDGRNSCAGYRLWRDGLSAAKSWFLVDDMVLCLGSGVSDKSGRTVATAIDQCRMVGDAIAGGNGKQILAYRAHTLNNPGWLWHDHVGYVFLEPVRVGVDPGPRPGDWGVCNGQRAGQTETVCMFDAWIDHGVHPTDAGYAYVVMPGATADDLDRFAVTPGAVVLRKDRQAHAVFVGRKSLFMAVCFEPCAVQVPGLAGSVRVNMPCTLLIQHKAGQVVIWASSPEHATGILKVNLRFAQGAILDREVELELPGGADAGSTVGTGIMVG